MKVPSTLVKSVQDAMSVLPAQMNTPEARVMLYAIGLQESRFEHRKQIGGPAHGYWQFEERGGVLGVYRHAASKFWLSILCKFRDVPFAVPPIYAAIVNDDVLAAGLARLLLFTDPKRLPGIGADADALAWAYYLRTWRPGRPHPKTWRTARDAAREAEALSMVVAA